MANISKTKVKDHVQYQSSFYKNGTCKRVICGDFGEIFVGSEENGHFLCLADQIVGHFVLFWQIW